MDILDYRRELSNRGVTLHSRIITLLLDEITEALIMGEIRASDEGFSIFDFIGYILKKSNPRRVFKTLSDSDAVVRNSYNWFQFEGERQRLTPVTDMLGLLYIAYMVSSEFSQKLRSASAAQILADNENQIKDWMEPIAFDPVPESIAPIGVMRNPLIADKSQDEIEQLAIDYLQIRQEASKHLPTLINILDALADPAGLPEATEWYTAKVWLARNGYTMIGRQQRQFFLAIAECHRFLTVAQPRKRDGVNYYSNQHDLLLRTCANNTLKLAFKRTASFI